MRDNRLRPSHFTNTFSSARFNTVAGLFTARLRRLLLRQAICIALIFSLLFLPGSSYAFSQAPAINNFISNDCGNARSEGSTK